MEAILKLLGENISYFHIFIATAGIMLLVFLLWLIFGTHHDDNRSLKELNSVFFSESNILRKIDALALSPVFQSMWNEYYKSYCSGITAAPCCYVNKAALFSKNTFCRKFSRCVGGIALCFGAFLYIYCKNIHLNRFLPSFFTLAALVVGAMLLFDLLYSVIEASSYKKLERNFDRFTILSTRVLGGNAGDLSLLPIAAKLNNIVDTINATLTVSDKNKTQSEENKEYLRALSKEFVAEVSGTLSMYISNLTESLSANNDAQKELCDSLKTLLAQLEKETGDVFKAVSEVQLLITRLKQ